MNYNSNDKKEDQKDGSTIKKFGIVGVGTFISLLLGFLATPIITRVVAPEEYGLYSLFTMYTSIFIMVFSLGMDQALVRFFYIKDTREFRSSLLMECIWLPIILTITVGIIMIVVESFGVNIFGFELEIIILLIINTFIQLVYRFSLLIVRLQYKVKTFSVLNILQKGLYIVFAVPLLMVSNHGDAIVLCRAITLASVICLIISVVAAKDVWRIRNVNTIHNFEISYIELFRYSYPFIFSMGITILFQSLDKIALSYYCTDYEVGIYSSTMTLINVFAVVQTTFNSLWAPMAVEHYVNAPEDKEYYAKANHIITVIMFFLGISLILVKDIFAIILGKSYREAAYILPFLVFNPIMYTISETTVCGIMFKQKNKYQVLISIIACLCNLIGNSLLVPALGCKGAAISTGISYIVFFAMRTIISNKLYPVDFKLTNMSVITVLTLGYALYNTFYKFNVVSILLYLVCFFVLFLLYRETVINIIVQGIYYIKKFLPLHKKNKK